MSSLWRCARQLGNPPRCPIAASARARKGQPWSPASEVFRKAFRALCPRGGSTVRVGTRRRLLRAMLSHGSRAARSETNKGAEAAAVGATPLSASRRGMQGSVGSARAFGLRPWRRLGATMVFRGSWHSKRCGALTAAPGRKAGRLDVEVRGFLGRVGRQRGCSASLRAGSDAPSGPQLTQRAGLPGSVAPLCGFAEAALEQGPRQPPLTEFASKVLAALTRL